jgi:hypothetical protein
MGYSSGLYDIEEGWRPEPCLSWGSLECFYVQMDDVNIVLETIQPSYYLEVSYDLFSLDLPIVKDGVHGSSLWLCLSILFLKICGMKV